MSTHKLSVVIDKDLYKQVKIYCVQSGITLKQFVLNSLQVNLKEQNNIKEEKNNL